jgi:hypothetical protein
MWTCVSTKPGSSDTSPQVVEVMRRGRITGQVARGGDRVDPAVLDAHHRFLEPAGEAGIGDTGGTEQAGHRRRVGGRG